MVLYTSPCTIQCVIHVSSVSVKRKKGNSKCVVPRLEPP